jgi:hypothetical protein
MGLPPRSDATDAHHCIMVQVLSHGPTEYKCVARSPARNGELPSDHSGNVTVTIDNREAQHVQTSYRHHPDEPCRPSTSSGAKRGTVPVPGCVGKALDRPRHRFSASPHGHGPHAGPRRWLLWSACRRNTALGWTTCRRTSKARRWPTSYRLSSTSTSKRCKRSTRRAATVATDRTMALDSQSPIQACPGEGRVRQVDGFDPVGIVLHPGGDPVRPVDRKVVDDHEQLACGLADQAV